MRSTVRLLALCTAALAFAQPAFAQDTPPPPEEQEAEAQAIEADAGQDDHDSIVVTGTRVRQGGAQDIRHFRSVAADVGMPRPESLTVEGLMGEHDLGLPSNRACAQLFCLVTEAMAANLPGRPDDRLFVGLGFTSNIDSATWKREPLNLVAVVDKSGSMSGPPLDLVRRSLRQIVGQLREGDQLSIVLYGDVSHLYLAPTDIGRDRDRALAAIDRIESAGSTNMEAGLKVGYDTAFATAPAFRGNTRLMLFTDEQPNVGRTDSESFIGMAEAASRRKIGLTTIGVGVQFDGALATKVSSARGGNLFFISSEAEVASVFEKQLDTMVSEVAHDVTLVLSPMEGYRISGVYGVPDGLMAEGQDGAVSITVPTAFLSTNGGGIFLSLAKAREREYLPAAALGGKPLLSVGLSYVGARDGRAGADRLAVSAPSGSPSGSLRLAHLLVDEYFALRGATAAFHAEGNPKKAFALLKGLSDRLDGAGVGDLAAEKTLVRDMLEQTAFYAGYTGEAPKSLRHLTVVGTWEVSRAEGVEDLRRGDRLSFTTDREVLTRRRVAPDDEERESYEINERQIHLRQSGLVFNYRTRGDTMTMVHETSPVALYLKRVSSEATP
ncbi:MAG TPA: VWA domain-containing protein [Allosphingosinicella sp.]|jgi:Ca-activated chloride channel family protein